MPINILMPALSPTMEKGNLAKWLKKEGDQVKAGDVIAEIETDKATMEVEAVDEGTIGRILVADGTADVAVNQPIAILLAEGEDASAIDTGAGGPKPAAAPPQAAPKPAEAEAEGKTEPAAPAPEPAKGRSEADTGADGRSGARVFASPLARRLAREAGIDVALVKGSGPHGRVVKSDIEQARASGTGRAAPKAADGQGAPAPVAPMADDRIRALFAEGSYEVVPHDSMRRIIARRLVESKQTIPHFYLTIDLDIDPLMRLREEINAAAPEVDGKPAWKVSVNDFIIKALALALMRVPEANVSWTEGGMLKHKVADIGVAVAIPGGLITPVVRNADKKSLSAVSIEMKDLAGRARNRRLKPEEYQGGSTAVSNLGMYGVREFAAVINPPHATILAVGAGDKRAVVRNDQIIIARQMTCTLSTDHRAVDGALGAELMAAFRALIEKPAGMLA